MYSLVQLCKRVVHKIIIMAFNEIKHFAAFFQLWKKPNIESQNIVSLVFGVAFKKWKWFGENA